MEKKRDQRDVKSVRFPKEEWDIVGALATKLGVSRSEFIKRAAMREAGLVLAGAAPHYAGGPTVTPHNGGAKTFSGAKQRQKRRTESDGAGVPTPGGPAEAKRRPVAERTKPTPKAG